MTLLCSTLAAVITTVVWYLCPQRDSMRLGTLSLMYWGASLMWLVDAVTEYLQEGADRKSTRLNSSHWNKSRMPSSA